MKTLSRIELWAGALRIGRVVEAVFVAFLLLCLAALAGLVPAARANDAATLQHATTSEALVKTAEAQIETAKVLQILANRMTGGMAPAAAPQPQLINPAAKTCDGFGSCLFGIFKATTETVGDVVRAVTPIAAPYYGYKGQLVAADAQKIGFIEATKQAGLREATTQAGFQTAASIANAGSAALATVAAVPQIPTTAVTVTGNGPVNTGTGTITNASGNPVTTTQPPVVVVGTTTTTVNRGP